MSLFNYNRQVNIALVLVSFAGMLTLFLPWIVYPRLELTIKGYDGDGWLISIWFGVILILNAYSLLNKKSKKKKLINVITFIFSGIILLLSIYKVYAFHEDVNTFQSNDPLTSYAGAGVYLTAGLYVIGVISLISLLLSSLSKSLTKKKNLLLLLMSIAVIGLGYYSVFNINKNSNKLDKVEIQENLDKAFDEMESSLVRKRPDLFVEFVHPILYQSIGGKKKMIDIMASLYKDVDIKDGKIEKIYKTKTEGDVIQALLLQSFTFISQGQESTSSNKSIAFSYDGGRTWSFAGTEDRTFDEMKKILPELFDDLQYD